MLCSSFVKLLFSAQAAGMRLLFSAKVAHITGGLRKTIVTVQARHMGLPHVLFAPAKKIFYPTQRAE
jgi:hypothetical protein